MEWTFEHDEEFAELMESWAQAEPSLERMVANDSRLDQLERRVRVLESDLPRRNDLLEAVRNQRYERKEE